MESTGIMRAELSPNKEKILRSQQPSMSVFGACQCSSTNVLTALYLNKT